MNLESEIAELEKLHCNRCEWLEKSPAPIDFGVLFNPYFVYRVRKVLEASSKENMAVNREFFELVEKSISGEPESREDGSKDFKGIFSKYPSFFSSQNLFNVFEKKPLELILDLKKFDSSTLEILKTGYQTITPEAFVPFYTLGTIYDSGWNDLEEEDIKLTASFLENNLNLDLARDLTSISKNFPLGATKSLIKIMKKIKDSGNSDPNITYVAIHSVIKDTINITAMDRLPYLKYQKRGGFITDLAELDNCPENVFQFFHDSFMSNYLKNRRTTLIPQFINGLKYFNMNFDSNFEDMFKLIFKKVYFDRWFYENLEAVCIASSKVKDSAKLLEHIVKKTKEIQAATNEDQIDDEPFLKRLTSGYIENVCKILNANKAEEFTNIDECAQTNINSYVLLSRLGSGGSGTVYLASDEMLDLDVKVKIFNDISKSPIVKSAREKEGADSLEVVRRMIDTMRYAIRNYENICQVYRAGKTEDGRVFIVSDYVDGGSVEVADANGHYKIREDIKPEDAFGIFKRILSGLGVIHSSGKIVRDLKLNNVLVSADHERVMIDDLEMICGLEEIVSGARLSRGSDRYAAPEVFRNPEAYTIQSDQYSAGVCLLYMLAGQPTLISEVNAIQDEDEYYKKLVEILGRFDFGRFEDVNLRLEQDFVIKKSLLEMLAYNPESRRDNWKHAKGIVTEQALSFFFSLPDWESNKALRDSIQNKDKKLEKAMENLLSRNLAKKIYSNDPKKPDDDWDDLSDIY